MLMGRFVDLIRHIRIWFDPSHQILIWYIRFDVSHQFVVIYQTDILIQQTDLMFDILIQQIFDGSLMWCIRFDPSHQIFDASTRFWYNRSSNIWWFDTSDLIHHNRFLIYHIRILMHQLFDFDITFDDLMYQNLIWCIRFDASHLILMHQIDDLMHQNLILISNYLILISNLISISNIWCISLSNFDRLIFWYNSLEFDGSNIWCDGSDLIGGYQSYTTMLSIHLLFHLVALNYTVPWIPIILDALWAFP